MSKIRLQCDQKNANDYFCIRKRPGQSDIQIPYISSKDFKLESPSLPIRKIFYHQSFPENRKRIESIVKNKKIPVVEYIST